MALSTPKGSWGCSACPEAAPNAHIAAAATETPRGPGTPATGHCQGVLGAEGSVYETRSVFSYPNFPGHHRAPRSLSQEGPKSPMVPEDPPLPNSRAPSMGVPGQRSEVHAISPETQVLQRKGGSEALPGHHGHSQPLPPGKQLRPLQKTNPRVWGVKLAAHVPCEVHDAPSVSPTAPRRCAVLCPEVSSICIYWEMTSRARAR